MAPRYPVYERTGRLSLAAATPPRTDFASLRDSARGAQLLSEAADRVVTFAGQELGKQSAARGARDAAENPRAVLQQFEESAPSTAYDVAAYNAAVKISAADIEVKARSDIANALLEWEQNKGDPTALQARLAAITSGYSDVISELDPLTGASLRTALDGAGNAAFLSYSETHLKAERDRLRAGIHPLTASTTAEIEIAARNGQDFSSQLDAYRATAESLQITPDTIAKNIEKMRTQGERARVRGEFSRAPDKAQYLSDFVDDQGSRTGPARGLSEADQKTILSEMRAAIAGDNASRKSSVTASKDASREAVEAITGGNVVSEATISELTSRAEATGDAAAIADAQRAAALHDATKQMPAVAIGAQEEMVADAQQALSDALDPDDLELANDILKARESILANTRKALTTDQVSYVNGINGEAGVVDFDDIVAAATGDPMMSSPDNVLARRRQVIEMFAGANGNAQPLYFSKTEAQKFSDFFTDPNTPLADRLAFMTGVQNVFGPRADKVFAQLDDGKALMWAQAGGVLNATGNAAFISDVFQGSDYLRAGGSAPAQVATKATRDTVKAELLGVIGGGQARAQIEALAENAYVQRLRQGGVEDANAELWRRTVQEAMGASYTSDEHISGGVVEIDDNTVILHPSMSIIDADFIDDNLRFLTRETLSELVGAEIPQALMSDYDIQNIGVASNGIANQVRILNAKGLAVGNATVRLTDLRDALRRYLAKNPPGSQITDPRL